MQRMRFFLPVVSSQWLTASLFCALIIIARCYDAQAQAGRRSTPRKESPPATTPTPAEATPKTSPGKPEAAKLSLVVAYYMASSMIVPERAYVVFESFVQRLKDSPALNIITEKSMNRRKAIERAAAEKDTFVVWLRLLPDAPYADRPKIGDIKAGNLVTNYIVFAPINARVKADGQVYCRCHQRPPGSKGSDYPTVSTQPQSPSQIPVKYSLEEAGREAADRVIEAFELSLPP